MNIKKIFQQLIPQDEHNEQEQTAVSVNEVQLILEPDNISETIEAMIREEYLRQESEINVDNFDNTEVTDNPAIDPESSEHELPLSPQNKESNKEPEPLEEYTLSENKPFVKLAEECAGLMNEFDGYSTRLETEEGKMMAEMVVKRLQEVLERAGLERIDNETEFSVLRHSPVPMHIVQEGAPIVQTRFPGLALGNRVYRQARVIVDLSEKKQNQDPHEM